MPSKSPPKRRREVTISFRVSPEVKARIDGLAEELSKQTLGIKITRSSAVRLALKKGLERLGG